MVRKTYSKICQVCGDPFEARSWKPNAKYCCAHCRQVGIARSTAVVRGDKLRGRGEGKGYRKRNGKHEHRLVMEEYLGRDLLSTEIVHHIDGNKRNNDLSNLELISCQSEHASGHSRAYWDSKKGGDLGGV